MKLLRYLEQQIVYRTEEAEPTAAEIERDDKAEAYDILMGESE